MYLYDFFHFLLCMPLHFSCPSWDPPMLMCSPLCKCYMLAKYNKSYAINGLKEWKIELRWTNDLCLFNFNLKINSVNVDIQIVTEYYESHSMCHTKFQLSGMRDFSSPKHFFYNIQNLLRYYFWIFFSGWSGGMSNGGTFLCAIIEHRWSPKCAFKSTRDS